MTDFKKALEALREIAEFDWFERGQPIAPMATPTENAMRKIATDAIELIEREQ